GTGGGVGGDGGGVGGVGAVAAVVVEPGAPGATLASGEVVGFGIGSAAPIDDGAVTAGATPAAAARRAVPRGRIVAPRPTLQAEPVTINSRSSVSARIAAACGFFATRLRRMESAVPEKASEMT